MIRFFQILGIFLLFSTLLSAQEVSVNTVEKTLPINDTIRLDSVSISSFKFRVVIKDSLISSSDYTVDFEKALLIPSNALKNSLDSISVTYRKYPDFLTKKYYQFDPSIIVESKGNLQKLYSLSKPNREEQEYKPFDGLNTSGSISRGVTVGTNQNAVLNSELDLQITGKISENVSLRASIQDANIPVQQGGYSQNLDEFDQIFIELNGKNWGVRAGDVILQNNSSYFSRFTKNVQGISINTTLNHQEEGS